MYNTRLNLHETKTRKEVKARINCVKKKAKVQLPINYLNTKKRLVHNTEEYLYESTANEILTTAKSSKGTAVP
jgi:predicted AAA+ superfamily ATPase